MPPTVVRFLNRACLTVAGVKEKVRKKMVPAVELDGKVFDRITFANYTEARDNFFALPRRREFLVKA